MNKPDFNKAAAQAVRVLLKYDVCRVPVYPHQIIQKCDNTALINFSQFANQLHEDRAVIIDHLKSGNDVATTIVKEQANGEPFYICVYNREKEFCQIRFALSIELGHRALGHLGFREDSVRHDEAWCFARHLLYPRAFIRLCQEHNMPLTEENLVSIDGWRGRYIRELVNAHPAYVPAELNKQLKERMRPYVNELFENGLVNMTANESDNLLDLSTYMEGYED